MTATTLVPEVPAEVGRVSGLDRLRLRLRRHRLDQRLAADEELGFDPELRGRAAQLTSARKRVQIAAVLDRMLDEAEDPPGPFEARSCLARKAIRECAGEMRDLIERLDDRKPVAPCGVARTALLIREGDSPLYSRNVPAAELRSALLAATDAL